ncbi:DUF2937 family protein [Actibacterium ureilyticum]|uniref:DUF2937 family protein n=1 Tax=Actibacterium ureilyticum TaxID=1590614 RepID=UPI000BAA9A74|nr:DUF2937 family protein [Actibacterium ureilyticum]
MIRTLTLAGALAMALGLSQFPAFSQQYIQRLSGAVDELRGMVVAFDHSATSAGLTRQEALARLQGDAFEDNLRSTLAGSMARYDRLKSDYDQLRGQGVLSRLTQPWHFRDAELARRTWADFQPALPVSLDGLICAGIGFGAGWLGLSAVFAGMGRLLRRRA